MYLSFHFYLCREKGLIFNMKKGKIVLVGTGFVGMSMAYSMLNRGGIDELILIDIDKEKTKGEEMDLSHGLPYAPQKMKIKAGDYIDCKDAQIIVITAIATLNILKILFCFFSFI